MLGEWVDLKNTGDQSVTLGRIYMANRHFDANCRPENHLTIYWYGPSNITLAPGQIVRVHTGKSANAALMDAADQTGVHYHAYAEKGNFILDNRCGDDIGVYWKDAEKKEQKEDFASYDPNPPEGTVLRRVGAKLVV